ncbi:MAG: NAD-binding protein [Candidatus Neomarinimicrobiota bacterium]
MLFNSQRFWPQSGFRRVLVYLLALVIGGSLGFYFLGGENWTLLDSLYMTIITLSTVGYGEIHELNTLTRLWTIIVIIFGVSGITFIATQFIQEMVDMKSYRRKRMENRIAKMKEHYIVCGFGRMGEVICDELHHKRRDFVVIEQRNMNIEMLNEKGYTHIAGDATNEDILVSAGVEHAKGVVITLGSDPDNLFVTMTVKTLNPKVFILTRCSTIGSDKKFRRAGANKVVNPYVTGGHKMTELLLAPDLNDIVEIKTDIEKDRSLEFGIDQITLGIAPYLDGLQLRNSRLREDYNLMVLGIIEKNGKVEINPPPDYLLDQTQKAIIIGAKEDLERFKVALDTNNLVGV